MWEEYATLKLAIVVHNAMILVTMTRNRKMIFWGTRPWTVFVWTVVFENSFSWCRVRISLVVSPPRFWSWVIIFGRNWPLFVKISLFRSKDRLYRALANLEFFALNQKIIHVNVRPCIFFHGIQRTHIDCSTLVVDCNFLEFLAWEHTYNGELQPH